MRVTGFREPGSGGVRSVGKTDACRNPQIPDKFRVQNHTPNKDGNSEPVKSEVEDATLNANPQIEELQAESPKKQKKSKKSKKHRKQTAPRDPSTSRKVTSWSLNDIGQAALEILRAEFPNKKLIDLVSDALALAVGTIQAAPNIRFETLNSGDLIRVQGATAKLERILKAFRSDLIAVQKDPEDAETIASLAEKLETQLAAIGELREKLAKFGMVPAALSPANLTTAADLKVSLKAWRKNAADDEKPVFDLALTLLKPFLP
jgi:hypothetical protein